MATSSPWNFPLLRSLARVVTTIPFKNPDEVAPAANDTVYGLAAGIWTNDLTKAHRLIPQLRAGTVSRSDGAAGR